MFHISFYQQPAVAEGRVTHGGAQPAIIVASRAAKRRQEMCLTLDAQNIRRYALGIVDAHQGCVSATPFTLCAVPWRVEGLYESHHRLATRGDVPG